MAPLINNVSRFNALMSLKAKWSNLPSIFRIWLSVAEACRHQFLRKLVDDSFPTRKALASHNQLTRQNAFFSQEVSRQTRYVFRSRRCRWTSELTCDTAEPMIPFYVAGVVVLWGINAGANAMINCELQVRLDLEHIPGGGLVWRRCIR